MSTATIERTDIEPIIVEDLEQEDVCEAKTGCDSKAEWVEVMTCCGEETPLCDPHKVNDEVIYKQYESDEYAGTCTVCGFSMLGSMIMVLVTWRKK